MEVNIILDFNLKKDGAGRKIKSNNIQILGFL